MEPTEHFGIYFGYIRQLFQSWVSPFKPRQAYCRHPPQCDGPKVTCRLRPFWSSQNCHRSSIIPISRLFIRVRSVESLTWNTTKEYLPFHLPGWLIYVAVILLVTARANNLTLARIRCFATFGRTGGGGVGATPPWRFQMKRRRASRKRPADCSRRVLAIGCIIFGPRSIFDPVMAGQRSNFRKFYDFSTSRVHISKTIYRSGMGPSPACSPFNSAQNDVF